MSTAYNADQIAYKELLALVRRNFDKLDRMDKDIFLLHQERFYTSCGRGQKRKVA